MGSVYRKTVTRPLPNGTEMFPKAEEQFAASFSSSAW